MKHIAIVIDSLSGGGAEKVMLTLAQGLQVLGHSVTIFALKSEIEYQIPENISLVLPFKDYTKSLRGWRNRKTLSRLLTQSIEEQTRNKPYDLILVNLYESYRLVSACQLSNCHYVIHNSYKKELLREIKMGPIKYFYMRNILKNLTGKRLIGVSKGVSDELNASKLFTPLSVSQIYNPFDIEQIQTLLFQPTHVEAPTNYILHVGRAAKAKRHDILFQALRYVDNKYVLVCLSENEKKLDKLARKWGVRERVVLPGFTLNPYAWMNKADLMVLSSDFEGLPTVLIESLICGTPVVATDCPHGPSEILEEALSPFLVPPGDHMRLGQTIEQALQHKFTTQQLSQIPILQKIKVKQIAKQYADLCC